MEERFNQASIGKIPKGWEMVRLGDESIAEIRGNKTINGFERVAFIPMESVSDSDIYAKYEVRPMKKVKSFTYCEAGDLLLAKITPSLENGKQGMVPDGIPNGFALATTEVFPISCKNIDRLFLFYVLKFPKIRNKIIASMTGTTGRQRATKVCVNNLKIPLPPLPEQRKIAQILSTIDDAIQKVGDAITKTERLKQGLMQELLTKGIGHERFKDSEVEEIPEEWEVIKISDIGEVVTGTTPPTKVEEYWGEGYPFATPTDFSESKYAHKTERTVTLAGAKRGRIIPKDSVMVTCIASVGEVSLASEDCITNQQINSIICNEKIDPQYVYYSMLFRKNILKRWAGITTSPIIKKSLFEKFPLPCPPLSEQRKIASILSTVDKKLELERKRKRKLERIKTGLMNDLLTGKKRVEA